jgi:hypothetical protein
MDTTVRVPFPVVSTLSGLPVMITDEILELYASLFRQAFHQIGVIVAQVSARDRRRQAGRPVSERSRNEPHFVSLSAMRQETKNIAVAAERPL